MKCKACIKLQSLAFTVFGCECASLASSFVTFNKNDVVVKNNFPAIRQSFSSMRPFSLDMTDEKDYVSPMRQRPRPKGGDVAYTNENILRQMRFYSDIRKVGGSDCVQDIYARDPSPVGGFRYWFVGKVARCTGTVSPELAVARQLNLIEEHACRTRPIELGRHFGSLEFYSAPGDTELLAAKNDPLIRLQKVPRVERAEDVALFEVGLNLEIVTNQGVGFCIVRTDQGVVPPGLIGG